MSAYAALADEEVLRTALIGYPVRRLECTYSQYTKLKNGPVFLLALQPVDGSLWLTGTLKGLVYSRGGCLGHGPSSTPVIEVPGFERLLGVPDGPAGVLSALSEPKELSSEAIAHLERAIEQARAGRDVEVVAPGALAALLKDPYDDAPRLAYAAELRRPQSGGLLSSVPLLRRFAPEPQGDTRAEFIELQVQLAHRPPASERAILRKRELELLALNSRIWWPFGLSTWRAHRGFLTSVSLEIGHLESVATRLFALEPIEELELLDGSVAAIHRLAKLTKLPLRSLVVRGSIGDAGLAALVAADFLPALVRLNVADTGLGPDGVAELASWSNTRFETLVLTDNEISDEGAAHLGGADLRRFLRRLYLTRSGIEAEGLDALLAGGLPRLETLCLGENELGDEGAEAIARHATALPSLRHLELPCTDLGDAGVAALVASPLQLSRLDVRRNPIRDFGPLLRRFRAATLRTSI
jgi:hypothetical protein